MFCPRCSQQQLTEEIRFCSRCGFLMTGVSALLANEGSLPGAVTGKSEKPAPRKKGLKQGGILIILGAFLVPLAAVANASGEILGGMSIIFFLGGVLRMIYAMLFQSAQPQEKSLGEGIAQAVKKILPKKAANRSLPPSQDEFPIPAGNWRTTADLAPVSVTDNTTKLLDDERRTH